MIVCMCVCTSAMTSHVILITTEYLNAHFFSVVLFLYALQVLKGINLCRFSYIRLKGRIVRFILHHPVCTSVSFGGEGSLGQETADVGCE